jgi:hypothetical protein
VLGALRVRAEHGGTWRVSAHLARTAHWLLRADRDPRRPGKGAVAGIRPWMVETPTPYGLVSQPRPALRVDDGPREYAWVGRRWGTDEPAWATSG